MYRKKPIDFLQCHFQNGRLVAILDFSVSGLCMWQGFRSVDQVCFGISISNFICILFVPMGQRLLIFTDVAFKMATWQPIWIFRILNSNFSLALNIKSKLQQQITCGDGKKPVDFQRYHFQNGRQMAILDFLVSGLSLQSVGFEHQIQTSLAHYLCVWVDRSLMVLNDVQLQSTNCPLLPLLCWVGVS